MNSRVNLVLFALASSTKNGTKLDKYSQAIQLGSLSYSTLKF